MAMPELTSEVFSTNLTRMDKGLGDSGKAGVESATSGLDFSRLDRGAAIENAPVTAVDHDHDSD